MTVKNTTSTLPAATLSERELYAHFLRMPITHRTSFGAVLHEYTPDDELRQGGCHWGSLQQGAADIAEDLAQDESPLGALDCLMQDAENYAFWARKIHDDFEAFAKRHLITAGDKPDGKSLEYASWVAASKEHDANPRYSVPSRWYPALRLR